MATNPLDPTTPADSSSISGGAEHVRDMKSRLVSHNSTLTTYGTNISTLQGTSANHETRIDTLESGVSNAKRCRLSWDTWAAVGGAYVPVFSITDQDTGFGASAFTGAIKVTDAGLYLLNVTHGVCPSSVYCTVLVRAGNTIWNGSPSLSFTYANWDHFCALNANGLYQGWSYSCLVRCNAGDYISLVMSGASNWAWNSINMTKL